MADDRATTLLKRALLDTGPESDTALRSLRKVIKDPHRVVVDNATDKDELNLVEILRAHRKRNEEVGRTMVVLYAEIAYLKGQPFDHHQRMTWDEVVAFVGAHPKTIRSWIAEGEFTAKDLKGFWCRPLVERDSEDFRKWGRNEMVRYPVEKTLVWENNHWRAEVRRLRDEAECPDPTECPHCGLRRTVEKLDEEGEGK